MSVQQSDFHRSGKKDGLHTHDEFHAHKRSCRFSFLLFIGFSRYVRKTHIWLCGTSSSIKTGALCPFDMNDVLFFFHLECLQPFTEIFQLSSCNCLVWKVSQNNKFRVVTVALHAMKKKENRLWTRSLKRHYKQKLQGRQSLSRSAVDIHFVTIHLANFHFPPFQNKKISKSRSRPWL